jgi:hypothetical protein
MKPTAAAGFRVALPIVGSLRLGQGFFVELNFFRSHLPLKIGRRAFDQGIVFAFPESKSRTRRAISSAHASSAFSSTSLSRLPIREPAPKTWRVRRSSLSSECAGMMSLFLLPVVSFLFSIRHWTRCDRKSFPVGKLNDDARQITPGGCLSETVVNRILTGRFGALYQSIAKTDFFDFIRLYPCALMWSTRSFGQMNSWIVTRRF